MKWKYIVAVAVIAVAVAWIWSLSSKNQKLIAERDRYKQNTEVLSTDIERFKVNDSLNAARVRSLELSLEEFERFRASDAAMIEKLRQKNRELQSVNDLQVRTIIEMGARPRDTILIRDSVPIKAKAVHCGDEWYDFDGLMTDADFQGKLQVRDSLIVSETVEHKRFLGFLWKIKAIKNRQVEAVSLNPHTTIEDVVFVVIED